MNRFWFQVITTIVGTVAAVFIADSMRDKIAAIKSNHQSQLDQY